MYEYLSEISHHLNRCCKQFGFLALAIALMPAASFAGSFSVDPTSASFSDVAIGALSPIEPIDVIRQSGNVDDLAFTFSGDDAAQFVIQNIGNGTFDDCDVDGTEDLSHFDRQCTIGVQFIPVGKSSNTFNAVLRIGTANNDEDGFVEIPLSGTSTGCYNSIVEGAEECDDGNAVDGDGCNTSCAEEFCGDGTVNDSGVEQCDDGNLDDTDACRNNCQVAACGDAVVQAGVEACDDGNVASGDGCTADCSKVEVCGDGIQDTGENCDDGNNDDTDSCRNNCMPATCGDGVVNPSANEQCDDENNDDTDGCLSSCLNAVCGDGLVQAGVETCDDSNNVETDTCRNNCVLAICGDGVVQDGIEACDDANADDTDLCSNACVVTNIEPAPSGSPADGGGSDCQLMQDATYSPSDVSLIALLGAGMLSLLATRYARKRS